MGDTEKRKGGVKAGSKRGRYKTRGNRRIDEILLRLSVGQSQDMVVADIAARDGVATGTIAPAVRAAQDLIAAARTPGADELRRRLTYALGAQAVIAGEQGKPDLVRRILMDQARLNGLLVNREELSGPGGAPLQVETAARVYLPADRVDELPPTGEREGEQGSEENT
jgi:hypothetical protein